MNKKLADLSPRHAMDLTQVLLFRMTLRELEAATKVSISEMRRWHGLGILSFDPDNAVEVDDRRRIEVEFIAGLFRSGLTDEWVNKVLTGLPKPFCYHSDETFYSFAYDTWITLPVPDPEEIFEQYLADLAEDEDWDTLASLNTRILELVIGELHNSQSALAGDEP